MALTNAELLELIETAIAAILSGSQSYTIEGFSYTRANLADLRTWRDDIKNRIEQEGGRRRLAEF